MSIHICLKIKGTAKTNSFFHHFHYILTIALRSLFFRFFRNINHIDGKSKAVYSTFFVRFWFWISNKGKERILKGTLNSCIFFHYDVKKQFGPCFRFLLNYTMYSKLSSNFKKGWRKIYCLFVGNSRIKSSKSISIPEGTMRKLRKKPKQLIILIFCMNRRFKKRIRDLIALTLSKHHLTKIKR